MAACSEHVEQYLIAIGFPEAIENFRLSDEYHYQSLPLCVIDAVFSIGVRYEGVRNVVKRFCSHAGIQRIRSIRNQVPLETQQLSVADYLERYGKVHPDTLASTVFQNFQRTSTRQGILKAEAVGRFMSEIRKRNVNYLQDVPKLFNDSTFEEAIKNIPGQRSGISLQYFFMLAGNDNLVKPDRMVMRFLSRMFPRRSFDVQSATLQLQDICGCIQHKWNITITPRELDHWIWNYERGNE